MRDLVLHLFVAAARHACTTPSRVLARVALYSLPAKYFGADRAPRSALDIDDS